MSFFSSAKAKLAASKLAEEQLYAQAAEEVASGQIRQGLWAKALAEADGDETAAKGRYLKLRVEIMRAEAEVLDYVAKEAVKRPEQPEVQAYEPDPNLSPVDQAKQYLRHLGCQVTGGPDNYRIVDELGVPELVTQGRLLSIAKERGLKE